ncbi:MAG: sulfurtransferase TusA family protein [Nitrospira sp.]|nr:sulfurtransferase TusA family protein [Nitrospira sp.]HBP89584.1 preprotein translocase subunit TatB [Nitrospiraceae bacterium]HNP28394.1 sulfurtransferase TusA family protein [Nitrospirales bacterium]
MEELDLRGVICPYNFVKTKLKLESLEIGAQLRILLDEGEPIRNVPQSITNEGHQILRQERVEQYYLVVIQKEDV